MGLFEEEFMPFLLGNEGEAHSKKPRVVTSSAVTQKQCNRSGGNEVAMMRYSWALCILLIGAVGGPVFAKTLDFDCSFPTIVTEDGVAKQEFDLTFVVDTISGDAFIRGNNGVSPVIVLRGDYATTFLEQLTSGAVQTTTVADTGEAVHSRHTILGSSVLSPSQNYGSCRW